MNCPECHNPVSSVIDSRPKDSYVRRRRRCGECDHRWTTYEGLYPGANKVTIDIQTLHRLVDKTIRQAFVDLKACSDCEMTLDESEEEN